MYNAASRISQHIVASYSDPAGPLNYNFDIRSLSMGATRNKKQVAVGLRALALSSKDSCVQGFGPTLRQRVIWLVFGLGFSVGAVQLFIAGLLCRSRCRRRLEIPCVRGSIAPHGASFSS